MTYGLLDLFCHAGGAAVGYARAGFHVTGVDIELQPIGLMEGLLARCPLGVVADPFAGSGSTLLAAKNLGRMAIGVEIQEQYCEITARRLAQGVLTLGGGAS